MRGLFLCFQVFPETWGVAAEPPGHQREHNPQSPAVLQRRHGARPQLVQGNLAQGAGLPALPSPDGTPAPGSPLCSFVLVVGSWSDTANLLL